MGPDDAGLAVNSCLSNDDSLDGVPLGVPPGLTQMVTGMSIVEGVPLKDPPALKM